MVCCFGERKSRDTMQKKTKNVVKFGIIGFGRYAERRLVPAFLQAEKAELVAISKRNAAYARRKAHYNIPFSFSNPAELVLHPAVEAVLVCSPPFYHREHALLAARAGKHVMVEKPLAANADEVAEMIQTCQKNRVLFYPAFVMRFAPVIQEMRRIVQSGEIGPLKFVNAHFVLDASLSPRSWLNDPQISCGGPVADLGSHLFDLLMYLTGKPVVGVKRFLQPPYSREQIERNAIINLEFEGGILGSVFVSFDLPRESAIELYGRYGALKVQDFNEPNKTVKLLRTHAEGCARQDISNGYYYTAMLDHFAEVILEGKEPVNSAESGLQNQKILDIIYHSNTGGFETIN